MDAPLNSQGPRQGAGSGFLIATILLAAIIVIGAVYFWKARDNKMESDESLQTVQTQSDSDDTAAIEADLNATDVDGADYDLNESNFTAS